MAAMAADIAPADAAVEPPDDEGDSGFHFAETDPSQRFGRFDQVLGRGAFKVVYKAFDTQEGTEVAWNQVRVSELMSCKDAENKEERDRLFAEIRVLKALKHKNIMSFYDSWYDPRTYTVNFITELFTSGTLRQYRKRHKHIDEEVLKRWAWQILCGLVYLHGHNPPIIHRDLKCDNIFINGSDGVVKIGDLGLATMLRSRTAPQSVLGTPEFMAPELYEEEYDDRVDVYSFGMCLLELSTMEYPYSECKNAAQIYRKVSLGVRPQGLQRVATRELAEFINLCIGPRETRPRARQLLKHPYFDSIRKDKLLSSRSDAALAGGHEGSEYGSLASGPVSRTASSLNELVAAISSGGHPAGGAAAAAAGALQGPPSVGSVVGASLAQHPLSRTVSTDAHSDRAPSDSASVRSQRSNASELALAVLENIAEEGEASEHGGALAFGEGVRSQQASKQASPHGSPPSASSPTKPGSPTSSDGCRCDATERRFSVKGDLLEGDTRVQLRLRICEPTGASRTVEFEFDAAVDTAASVAGEMVSDLELTPEDAAVIASTLKDELARLSAHRQMDPQASLSLANAARVFEHSLTANALEQAHSGSGNTSALGSREPSLVAGSSARQLGRFSEQTISPLPPLPPSPPLSAPPSAPPSEGLPSGRPSLEGQHQQPPSFAPPLRPSGGSTSSLVSASSASSIPYSLASQPELPQPQPAAPQPLSSLARLSPPPRPPSSHQTSGEVRQPARPVSPLAPAGVAQADVPSPSQRVLRSNSVDAMSLLSRSASLPPGREAAASPLTAGSGALSPTSGILSPSVAVHEKRVPLNKLFENLAEVVQQRTDSLGLEPALASAGGSGSLQAHSLPPLPQAAGPRTLQSSTSSGSVGEGRSSADLAPAMLRPRSEACLTVLPRLGRLSASDVLAAAGTSAPVASGLAAAVALSDVSASLASPRSASSNVSPRSTNSVQAAAADAALRQAATTDAMQRLDLHSTAAVPPQQAAARVGNGVHALSAPASKVPSRDASPGREGSLSPTRAPADPAAANGKRPPIKDKEALRRQAADAMKAVELRSLNLLEGGLAACRVTRGVPMAATKTMASLCGAAAATPAQQPVISIAAVPAPAANGIHPIGAAAQPALPAAGSRPPTPPLPATAPPPALVPPPSTAS